MGSHLDISNTLTVVGHVLHRSTLEVQGDTSLNGCLNVFSKSTFDDIHIGGVSSLENNVYFGSSNTDISFTLHGDMVIKSGGNIIIEDNSFSITELKTEVQISDILEITKAKGNGSGSGSCSSAAPFPVLDMEARRSGGGGIST